MENLLKILRSQRGQTTVEMLVGIIGVASIAVAVTQALTPSIGDWHDKTVENITDITGSGM